RFPPCRLRLSIRSEPATPSAAISPPGSMPGSISKPPCAAPPWREALPASSRAPSPPFPAPPRWTRQCRPRPASQQPEPAIAIARKAKRHGAVRAHLHVAIAEPVDDVGSAALRAQFEGDLFRARSQIVDDDRAARAPVQ